MTSTFSPPPSSYRPLNKQWRRQDTRSLLPSSVWTPLGRPPLKLLFLLTQ